MTFLDTDVIRVREEVLPAGFGGGVMDCQLAEEEGGRASRGSGSSSTLASAPSHPESVAAAFPSAVSGGPGAARLMGVPWRDAHLPRRQAAAVARDGRGERSSTSTRRRVPPDALKRLVLPVAGRHDPGARGRRARGLAAVHWSAREPPCARPGAMGASEERSAPERTISGPRRSGGRPTRSGRDSTGRRR